MRVSRGRATLLRDDELMARRSISPAAAAAAAATALDNDLATDSFHNAVEKVD